MAKASIPYSVTPKPTKRFRANPVEIAIFSVISIIFCNSAYRLVNEQGGFRPAALSPMAANPISEGRSPASVIQPFANVDVRCEAASNEDTSATKVRLTGPLCGATKGESDPVVKVTAVNDANKFSATIFTDSNSGKFSTNYIPLNMGKNSIRLEFAYRSGRTIDQELNIMKN